MKRKNNIAPIKGSKWLAENVCADKRGFTLPLACTLQRDIDLFKMTLPLLMLVCRSRSRERRQQGMRLLRRAIREAEADRGQSARRRA